MRLLVIIVLAACLMAITAYADIPQAYGDEEEIWSYLEELCPSDEMAAGIMGWFFRESRLKADAVAGWDVRGANVCEKFAEDHGDTKEEFIRRVQAYGGYGLGQWLNYDYLDSFYDHVEVIDDVKAQCEFAVWSLQQNEELWNELLNCQTAIQCGRRIGLMYDGTTVEGAEAIAGFAQYYYERMVNDEV